MIEAVSSINSMIVELLTMREYNEVVLGMKGADSMIYLDNAATTLVKPEAVINAVCQALCSMGNAGRGQHGDALSADRIIYETRVRIAGLFNAGNSRQVAFTKNSTEALNMAIRGLAKPGDHVITTAQEHNSVLRPLYFLEDKGIITLDVLGLDELGRIDLSGLDPLYHEKTAMVVVNHGSNVTGNLADLKRIGEFCREKGIWFVVDASQTAGVFPIDMQALGIHVLCFTGHKSLLGPQGTGGLCVAKDVPVESFLVGGSGIHSYDRAHPQDMPTRLEAGTLNAHSLAGLLAALGYIEEQGMDRLREREVALARRFHDGVAEIPGIRFYGDYAAVQRCPLVTLNIGEADAGLISMKLEEDHHIATRPGAHCAPLVHEHFGTRDQGMVRFSFSSFNTEEEINTAVSALKTIAKDIS